MPWTWPHSGHLDKPATKPSNQHVLEMPTVTLRHPSTIPLLLDHSLARTRRSSAGRFTVEHLVCVLCTDTTPADQRLPEPPDRPSVHHPIPRTPQARARASAARTAPSPHVPAPPAA